MTSTGTTASEAAARKDLLDGAQRSLRAGALGAAARHLAALLAQHPDDVDGLYLLAVVNRYAGRPEAAATALERLQALSPDNGRAHQEEGHLLRGTGREEQAILAYARACQCNPALAASHRALIELLTARGREAEAAEVRRRLDRLLALPKPLVAATDLLAQGRLLQAEDICRAFLRKVPDHVEGMRLLAEIGVKLGVLDDAEFLLESAVAFAPDDVGVRIDYIGALRKRQKFARALEEARALLRREPDNPRFKSIFAIESMQTGDFATALETFAEVLEQVPGDPATLTAMGHALKTSGRYEEAVGAYRRALDSQPRHGEAWYALANLKTYTFSDAELERMHALEHDSALGQMERVHLCFALGKAYEDRREYGRSFEYYARGNRAKKLQSRYDADRMHEDLEAQKRVCTAAFFAEREGFGHPAPDPIFIVGLPRAGSTLLEQILSSHSLVDGTLELPNVLSLSQQLRRRGRDGGPGGADGCAPGYPDVLARLRREEFAAFGRQYIEDTRIHRRGAPFFIDKMPNNFRHIGLIHLMLPEARIIDARRQPMACCFSGYKQLFAEGQEFTYSLEDVGRYYRDYVSLMDHWDAVLPGRVLRVQHEDVVDDLEGQVRRMLDFCGLPFEEGCLRYWETERNVRTPSSEQVRRPIFRESVEQWRYYAPWLGALEDALGPALARDRAPRSA